MASSEFLSPTKIFHNYYIPPGARWLPGIPDWSRIVSSTCELRWMATAILLRVLTRQVGEVEARLATRLQSLEPKILPVKIGIPKREITVIILPTFENLTWDSILQVGAIPKKNPLDTCGRAVPLRLGSADLHRWRSRGPVEGKGSTSNQLTLIFCC